MTDGRWPLADLNRILRNYMPVNGHCPIPPNLKYVEKDLLYSNQ
jgi:hypothetical protein